jgi:hypothetical protein
MEVSAAVKKYFVVYRRAIFEDILDINGIWREIPSGVCRIFSCSISPLAF